MSTMNEIGICLLFVVFARSCSAHSFSISNVHIKDTNQFDEYGSTVYSKGNKLVIGAPVSLNLLGRVLIYHRKNHDADFQFEGEYYGRSVGEHFGHSLAMIGDALFVGSPYKTCFYDNTPFYRCGGVHVFDHSNGRNYTGSQWATHTIEPEVKDAYNLFGYSLASSDNVLAVGSPGYNGYLGHVTLYTKDPLGAWSRLLHLAPTHNVFYGKYGYSLGMYDRLLAVGAPGDMAGSVDGAGSVHVYMGDETESAWELHSFLKASEPVKDGGFGSSLSIYNNAILVGAPKYPGHTYYTGVAYLFEIDDPTDKHGTIDEVAMLKAHDGVAGDEFGCSVSMYGSTIAVGACSEEGKMIPETGLAWQLSDGENCGDFSVNCVKYEGAVARRGDAAGALYLYSYDLVKGTAVSQWTEIRKVLPKYSDDDWYFGSDVSVNGDTVLVGASGAEGPNGQTKAGAVYEVRVDWLYYKNSVNLHAVVTGIVVVAIMMAIPLVFYIIYLVRGTEFFEGIPGFNDFIADPKAVVFGSSSGDSSSGQSLNVSLRSTHGLLEMAAGVSSTRADDTGFGKVGVAKKPEEVDWGISRPSRKKPIGKPSTTPPV